MLLGFNWQPVALIEKRLDKVSKQERAERELQLITAQHRGFSCETECKKTLNSDSMSFNPFKHCLPGRLYIEPLKDFWVKQREDHHLLQR